jgi:hypothetical protein
MWSLFAISFLAIGLVLVLFTRASGVIKESIADVTTASNPAWKVAAFRIVVHCASVIFWPFFLRSWFAKPKTVWDVLNENPILQQNKLLSEALSLMSEDGIDADELPSGRGEFGMTSSNPIPCKTVLGTTTYLGLLRTLDGTKVVFERSGSVASDVTPHPVDVYEISHPNGPKLATLFISPYQKRNSAKAPSGFMFDDTFVPEPA